MYRILVIAALFAAASSIVTGANAQVSTQMVKKPQMTTMPNMSSMRPMCSDPATSNVGGTATACAPMACNSGTGHCFTSAKGSDQCAPGYLYWAPDSSCQHCPLDGHTYWDEASHSCKPGQKPA